MSVPKRLVRSKSGLRIVCQNNKFRSPLTLDEPMWIPDTHVIECMSCHGKFDFLKRRHHCRRCGKIYCGTCCNDKSFLPRMCFVDPVRLCTSCYEVTTKENQFYEFDLAILLSGEEFIVDCEPDIAQLCDCKLSNDHRELICYSKENDKSMVIQLECILSAQVMKSQNGNHSHGVLLCLKSLQENENKKVIFTIENGNKQDNHGKWLTALQKAVLMVYESRRAKS